MDHEIVAIVPTAHVGRVKQAYGERGCAFAREWRVQDAVTPLTALVFSVPNMALWSPPSGDYIYFDSNSGEAQAWGFMEMEEAA